MTVVVYDLPERDLHEDDLNQAAMEAIRHPLIKAWRVAGYRVQLGSPSRCECVEMADDPADEVWIAVRERAVDLLDVDELLSVAGLDGEYEAWRQRQDDRDC